MENTGLCIFIRFFIKVRNFSLPSLNHLSHHDSVANVIKMAVQRGMGITQIMKRGSGPFQQVKFDFLSFFCFLPNNLF